MKVTRKSLKSAVDDKILTSDQAERLFQFLSKLDTEEPTFDFTHILYYFGGLVAIGAMSIFLTLGWESFGGVGIVLISVIYAVIGILLTNHFRANGHSIPAGICATFIVALTPLAIYGAQQALGLWPDRNTYQDYHHLIKKHWLPMEVGTLLVGVILARIYKYPFLIMPIAFTFWYISMDITALISNGDFNWDLRNKVSIFCGLIILPIAIYIDIKHRKGRDYAFWLYFFGVLMFWGGLTALKSDSELGKFVYFCINITLIGIGAVLSRKVFVIFGAIGSFFYLNHLANSVFENSWLYPIMLTIIGLLIICLGLVWQKNEAKITTLARSYLPNAINELLESRHF